MIAAEKSPDLPTMFRQTVEHTIDEKGFCPHYAMHVDRDGGVCMSALAVTPTQTYQYVLMTIAKEKPSQLIFGLDRYCKPGQGTTLGDCVAGFCILNGSNWRPFVVEYRHEPRIVKPIDWENGFWNLALRKEALEATTAALKSIGIEAPTP